MTLSTNLKSYEDCLKLYDIALNDPAGARACLGTVEAARMFRLRMHQARKLTRGQNERTYKRDDPLWGTSEYDGLVCRIREDEEGEFWVYVEPSGTEILVMEGLSDED